MDYRAVRKETRNEKINITSKQQHGNIAHRGYFKDTSTCKEIKIPYRTHDSRLPVKYFIVHAMPQNVKRKDIVN